MRLFRVFPSIAGAREGEPGHALYVTPLQRGGRADDPKHYLGLYLASAPAGAVAEAFGTLREWVPEMFISADVPGAMPSLATCSIQDDAAICDLDDAPTLERLGLRPSDVVTRHKDITQAWVLRIFQERKWLGVRWWSYYDSRWYSYAVWDTSGVSVERVEPLGIDHPAVIEAADVLRRPRANDRKR